MTKTPINQPAPETTHVVTLGEFCGYCTIETFSDVADELVSKHGPGVPTVRLYTSAVETPAPAPEAPVAALSTWEEREPRPFHPTGEKPCSL